MGRRRVGWWAGVVAAACLLAACAGEAAPSDSTGPSVPGAGWARVQDGAMLGGGGAQGMRAVALIGPGLLVAVGTESLEGDSDAAVWTSVDGVTWARVPHEASLGGIHDQTMRAVTAGGPGLVAVGTESRGDDSDAAVWVSADGLTWTRVPHDEAVFGGNFGQAMNAVTAGGPGLVAVGYDEMGAGISDAGGRATRAAVWTSVDGVTWSRVPHDESVFGGENSQAMNGVAAGGPGLVAVGYDSASRGWSGLDANAAVWVSPDGIAWTRVPDTEVFGNNLWQAMNAVAAGGPGLVAVGYGGALNRYDAAVWTSDDGLHWTAIPQDESVFGGPDVQGMNAVASGCSGLVAVGYDRARGSFEAAVWYSADGVTWTRVPADRAIFGGLGSQRMNGVTAAGPGLVAVGHQMALVGWVPRDSDAAVWVSPPGSASGG